MQNRKSRIIGIVLTVILSFFFIASGIFKFAVDPTSAQGLEFATTVGAALLKPIAVAEFIVVLFIWMPRTATLGYILSFGFWSGACATQLTHSSAVTVQPVFMLLTLVAAFFRTPELYSRLLGLNQPKESRGET
jgi:hypothetical protein